MSRLVGGLVQIKIDGVLYSAKGSFDYNLGSEKREAIVGHDGVHGYKALPQVPYIEGTITDSAELSLAALTTVTQATVTLDLANGKTVVLNEAWYAADGKGSSEEGELEFRFEGVSAQEL